MFKWKKFIIFGMLMILLLPGTIATNSVPVEKTNTIEKETTQTGMHTAFLEEGTASWCINCPYVSEILQEIYESGEYPFYFVSLVYDENVKAQQRLKNHYNIYGFPTVFFDGGYDVVMGTDKKSVFEEKILNATTRDAPDLYLQVNTTWDESEKKLGVNVTIQNNESDTYTGNLKVYVTEIVSRWSDYKGNPYHYGLLDFAVDTDIEVQSQDTYNIVSTWDATAAGFSHIYPTNLMVFAVVFNSDSVPTYSDPPLNNHSFNAHFADQSAAVRVAEGNLPPGVGIVSPKKKAINLFGKPIRSSFLGNTVLLGATKITVNASDDSSVDRVEFYINGELKFTDSEAPYEWIWHEFAFGKYTIGVKAYDDQEENTTASMDVFAFML